MKPGGFGEYALKGAAAGGLFGVGLYLLMELIDLGRSLLGYDGRWSIQTFYTGLILWGTTMGVIGAVNGLILGPALGLPLRVRGIPLRRALRGTLIGAGLGILIGLFVGVRIFADGGALVILISAPIGACIAAILMYVGRPREANARTT